MRLSAAVLGALSFALCAAPAEAQLTLTATSANVAEAGHPVRIRIHRWSTDEERAPLVAALNPAPPAAAGARGGAPARGAGAAPARGRAARGRGPAAPLTPEAALTAAINRGPTVGYIWTDDITGYSIKYAWRTPLPEGGERIVLATNRRLGAHLPAWKPAAPVTDYEFTLLELRLDAKGAGQGKASLTSKVVVDKAAGTVALENYDATPAVLQNIKR